MLFVDTNVLLSLLATDPYETHKAQRAEALLNRPDLALSVQVLQEFYVQATRASRLGHISHAHATALIVEFSRYPVQETTLDLVRASLASKQRFGLSYWDAAIVEAARALGCETVLTEDLSPDQDYGGIRAVNPFLD